jgi:hypothetical protein
MRQELFGVDRKKTKPSQANGVELHGRIPGHPNISGRCPLLIYIFVIPCCLDSME